MLNDQERTTAYLRAQFDKRTANLTPEAKAELSTLPLVQALELLDKWEPHLRQQPSPEAQQATLTAEQKTLAERMGLSEKDVLASLEEQRRRQQ